MADERSDKAVFETDTLGAFFQQLENEGSTTQRLKSR
jgi:hypothetical protein